MATVAVRYEVALDKIDWRLKNVGGLGRTGRRIRRGGRTGGRSPRRHNVGRGLDFVDSMMAHNQNSLRRAGRTEEGVHRLAQGEVP